MAATVRSLQGTQILIHQELTKLETNIDAFSKEGRWGNLATNPPHFSKTLELVRAVHQTAQIVQGQISQIPVGQTSLFQRIQDLVSNTEEVSSSLEDRVLTMNENARELLRLGEELKGQVMLSDPAAASDLNIAFSRKIVSLISNADIQNQDTLKASIAKVLVIGCEFFVLQFVAEKRSVYPDTYVNLSAEIAKVLSTLPKTEARACFELQCANAMLKKLDIGEGKWKILAKNNRDELLAAVTEIGISQSPTGLVLPIIRIALAIYHNIEDHWYKKIWALRWLTTAQCMNSVSNFENNRPIIQESTANYQLAIKVSDLFKDIMLHSSDPALKAKVFRSDQNEDISLFKLAELKTNNHFWRTRYLTLVNLAEIFHSLPNEPNETADAIIKLFVSRVAPPSKESRPFVRSYAQTTLLEFVKQQTTYKSLALEDVNRQIDSTKADQQLARQDLLTPPASGFMSLDRDEEMARLGDKIKQMDYEIQCMEQLKEALNAL